MTTPLIKSVLIRRTGTIGTKLETRYFEAGEVALLRFASENEFRAMLPLGVFVEHDGPPPAYIKSTPLAPANAEQKSPQVVPTQNPFPAAVMTKSRKCEDCRTMLILTNAQYEPDKPILFCPNCNKEVDFEPAPKVNVIESQKKVESKPNEIPSKDEKAPKRVVSRCKCGGVKAAKATLCKKCLIADMANSDVEVE